MDTRNFFTPPLDYDDITTADILLKIESVEDFVESVYFGDSATTSAKARIPCLLLIAAKVISNPTLAKKYYTIKKEVLGDYSYELGGGASSKEGSMSPWDIAMSWEKMAIKMLEERSELANMGVKYGLWKANS